MSYAMISALSILYFLKLRIVHVKDIYVGATLYPPNLKHILGYIFKYDCNIFV